MMTNYNLQVIGNAGHTYLCVVEKWFALSLKYQLVVLKDVGTPLNFESAG